MTLDVYSGLFDDDINGAGLAVGRAAEARRAVCRVCRVCERCTRCVPDDHEQAADGGIGPETGAA
jgi:hypothetical protein